VFIPDDTQYSIDTVKSDTDGVFRIEGVPPGAYWVGPAAKSLKNPSSKAICPEAVKIDVKVQDTLSLTIRAPRGLFIRGRVDSADRYPLGNVNVDITDMLGVFNQVYSDEDGSFKLGPLTERTFEIDAISQAGNGAVSPRVKVKAGASDVVLRLVRLGRLNGVVLDGATRQPIPATVSVSRVKGIASVVTFSSSAGIAGTFSFKMLPAGEYTLTATALHGRTGTLTGVQLGEGETKSGLEILVK
jgi:hypothetical protein